MPTRIKYSFFWESRIPHFFLHCIAVNRASFSFCSILRSSVSAFWRGGAALLLDLDGFLNGGNQIRVDLFQRLQIHNAALRFYAALDCPCCSA